MRVRAIAVAAVLTLAALTLGAGHSVASEAKAAKLGCKLTGVRYVGAGSGKAAVCFTLTANGKSMREHDYDPCAAASKVVFSHTRVAKPVSVRANGTFSTTRRELAVEEGADPLTSLSWVTATFSGRIQGNRASGSLVVNAGSIGKFRCAWTARRASG